MNLIYRHTVLTVSSNFPAKPGKEQDNNL